MLETSGDVKMTQEPLYFLLSYDYVFYKFVNWMSSFNVLRSNKTMFPNKSDSKFFIEHLYIYTIYTHNPSHSGQERQYSSSDNSNGQTNK